MPVCTASGSSTNSSPRPARWWVSSISKRAAPRSTTATSTSGGSAGGRRARRSSRAAPRRRAARPAGSTASARSCHDLVQHRLALRLGREQVAVQADQALDVVDVLVEVGNEEQAVVAQLLAEAL